MSKDYIQNNYVITPYATNDKQYKGARKIVTPTLQNSLSSSTEIKTAYYNFIEATSSSGTGSYLFLPGGDENDSNHFQEPKQASFGKDIVVSGSGNSATMIVSWDYDSGSPNASNTRMSGVGIFKSSSASNWTYVTGVFPAVTQSLPTRWSFGDSVQLHGDYLSMGAWRSSAAYKGFITIYKSSSTGWNHEANLDTSSLPSSSGFTGLSTSAYGMGHSHIMCDNTIIFPWTEKSSKYYLHVFTSSSAGWEYKQSLAGPDTSNNGGAPIFAQSRRNLAFDSDVSPTRLIAGCRRSYNATGDSTSSKVVELGTIFVYKKSGSNWAEETKLTPSGSIGLDGQRSFNSNVCSTQSGPEIATSASADALSCEHEWRLYEKFGEWGCDISGSYIAAAVKGKALNVSSTDGFKIQNKILIYQYLNGSWKHEATLENPNTFAKKRSGASAVSGLNLDYYGFNVRLSRNQLAVSAPGYNPDDASLSYDEGIVYLYKSASASGWTLHQTLKNPVSGSSWWPGHSGGPQRHTNFGGTPSYSGTRAEGAGLGFKDGHLVVSALGFSKDADNDEFIEGAVFAFTGSHVTKTITINIEVTRSVDVVTYEQVTGASIPFRYSRPGLMNIRNQTKENPYKSFPGVHKSKTT